MQITEHRENAFHDVTDVLIFGHFTTSQALKKEHRLFFCRRLSSVNKDWPTYLTFHIDEMCPTLEDEISLSSFNDKPPRWFHSQWNAAAHNLQLQVLLPEKHQFLTHNSNWLHKSWLYVDHSFRIGNPNLNLFFAIGQLGGDHTLGIG